METDFPNDNNINIKISSESEEEIIIALRIPSYAENYTVFVNDQTYKFETDKGYAIIKGKFKNDKIKIKFDAPAKFVYANPLVRADSGKVAITKGPLVYCLEEVDNKDNLSAIFVDTSVSPIEKYDEGLFGGTTIINLKGKIISNKNWNKDELYGEQRPIYEDITLNAVPYCYWGNRKPGEMAVWMKTLIRLFEKF